jgi:AdoMet-dependent heme synthase
VKPTMPSQRMLRMLFWETTVRCNLACAHCRRLESNDADIADLSTSQAKGLIDQLAELGRRQQGRGEGVGEPQDARATSVSGIPMPVLVFSGGEPLCRADLFPLIERARRQGIIPALATNGTLIDSEKARLIHEAGIERVSVSLDGATAEVHDRMRQIPGAFDSAIAGIRRLHEHQVPFQINMTLTRQNAGQLATVYELARSLGAVAVHLFMLVPVGCGEVLAETDMLSPQQYEEILREICTLESRNQIQIKVTCGPHYERVKRQLELEVRSVPTVASKTDVEGVPPSNRGEDARDTTPPSVTTHAHRPSKGCLAGLGVLFVSHRGEVYPCGYLPVDCGNVLEGRLVEIWDGNEDLARMRDVAALEGKCGVCGYKQVCGGCRARAFAATGNYMGEEPFCAYVPRMVRGPTP